MEQYLTLTRGNQAPSVAKPEIKGNINFEIKSQFMREMREDTFAGVTHDAVMLRVFPITLTEAAKRWVDKITPGTVNTWDLLKKAFIQRYCPPSKTAKQLEEFRNFKQEGDETLYQAWERSSSGINTSFLQKEQGPECFILPCSIGRLDFNNALADLGASISIMPFSMYKRLGMGKLEPINMVIEMADNTKSIPKGIVKNLLIRIDKFIFPIDFVILDIIEDYRMPIILGRPLLATAHAKVDIFRKSISLEVGNEKVIFKMRSSCSATIFEFVQAIKSKIHMGDDDLIDSESYEFDQLLGIDLDIFAYDIDMQGSYKEPKTDQEKGNKVAQEALNGNSSLTAIIEV
ncbi:zinc knuckle CX2CX4HX4C containing protein [Tanacetum coccineum]